MKDYIDSNEKLDKALHMVYERLMASGPGEPTLVFNMVFNMFRLRSSHVHIVSKTVELNLGQLRTHLLFPNSHPIVQEDVERLKGAREVNEEQRDLNWTKEPEQKHPKWLKQHWAMMKDLKAFGLGQ